MSDVVVLLIIVLTFGALFSAIYLMEQRVKRKGALFSGPPRLAALLLGLATGIISLPKLLSKGSKLEGNDSYEARQAEESHSFPIVGLVIIPIILVGVIIGVVHGCVWVLSHPAEGSLVLVLLIVGIFLLVSLGYLASARKIVRAIRKHGH
jgi:hypothetical protein